MCAVSFRAGSDLKTMSSASSDPSRDVRGTSGSNGMAPHLLDGTSDVGHVGGLEGRRTELAGSFLATVVELDDELVCCDVDMVWNVNGCNTNN